MVMVMSLCHMLWSCHYIQHIILHRNFVCLAISNLKYRNYNSFYQFLLLLSGDVSLNPGPVQIPPPVNVNIWEPFNKKGLHFLHININSLLPKIYELKCIANKTKAAIIGITESKLDHTVPDLEVNFPGYDILRCDRNRNGGGVACYIRKDLCFNTKALNCKEIENIIFDILLPKSKPITAGVFYTPPNQANFMELIFKTFSLLNLKDNEIYLLGDFNINLLQNGNYILNRKGMAVCQGAVHTLVNKYQVFCQIFSLKQLITCPTRVTCNTSSLIDHILTNSTEKIFQSGIIDCGMSDHQLIFCTRKVKRAKFNKHSNVFLRSLKHYTVNVFVEILQKVNFSNYERFSCIDAAYTDFLNKLMKVVNEIAPSKEIRIKNSTQEWFDREIAELIHAREFKKSKLHIDEENYKKVEYQVQNLIRKKKREFYETNLRQKINKPKELWKTLKSMGLPSKAITASNICLKDKSQILFSGIKNCSIFKNYFSSLAQKLVSKLPLSPNIFTESKIILL